MKTQPLLSVPSRLEPTDARQREMWPVPQPVRLGVARDPSQSCDRWPMAQECWDRVQASTKVGPAQSEDCPVVTLRAQGIHRGSRTTWAQIRRVAVTVQHHSSDQGRWHGCLAGPSPTRQWHHPEGPKRQPRPSNHAWQHGPAWRGTEVARLKGSTRTRYPPPPRTACPLHRLPHPCANIAWMWKRRDPAMTHQGALNS